MRNLLTVLENHDESPGGVGDSIEEKSMKALAEVIPRGQASPKVIDTLLKILQNTPGTITITPRREAIDTLVKVAARGDARVVAALRTRANDASCPRSAPGGHSSVEEIVRYGRWAMPRTPWFQLRRHD